MTGIDDNEIDEDTLPTRGRRAAPKSRFTLLFAALLDPAAPLVARVAAWLSAHRLGALLTVSVIVAVIAIGSGAALMRTVSETAFSEDSQTSVRDGRAAPEPGGTESDGPSGPILPTPAPPLRVPEPTTGPSETAAPTPEPGDLPEPTTEPEPSDTPEPSTDHPGNNGKGKGTPGGPKKPD
ncbi:hypothetical protein [Agromyces neolithicus]|uniref:Uncharacterized protein n=1 Tax=Agromyces neolithicus TaxID=269420 RepID=A0ABN2M5U2_9MICO